MRRIGLNSSGSVWRLCAVVQTVTNLWVAYNGEVIWLAQETDILLHGVGRCVLPSSSLVLRRMKLTFCSAAASDSVIPFGRLNILHRGDIVLVMAAVLS